MIHGKLRIWIILEKLKNLIINSFRVYIIINKKPYLNKRLKIYNKNVRTFNLHHRKKLMHKIYKKNNKTLEYLHNLILKTKLYIETIFKSNKSITIMILCNNLNRIARILNLKSFMKEEQLYIMTNQRN